MFVFLLWCERHGHGHGSVVDVQSHALLHHVCHAAVWNLFNAKCLGSSHSTFRYLWRDRGLLLVLGFILAASGSS
jgi:Ca2+-transporting ATPase